MSATRLEFDRFLLWLGQQNTTADARRLANGISSHFVEIAATTTAQGERARTIVRLLLRDFDTLDEALHVPADADRAAGVPWRRLARLDVGPFRGFTVQEPLDLSKRVVLIYGPNGSGKSSLCEAIEFALTGTVAEASAKRMADEDYCANAHAEAFAVPTLIASGDDGAEHVVASNPEALRFCIVEKNRIDEFSRISARTPREQARSIAALFGVEQFDEFVANFNESLDTHLDLTGRNAFVLSVKRTAIDADSRLITTAGERREELGRREAELATEFGEEYSIVRLRQWIGDLEHPGCLAELTSLLERPVPLAIGLAPQTIRARREALAGATTKLHEVEEQLHARQREVSYKQLFEAVSALQEESPDRCPACETPLAGGQIAQDPYEHARKGLAELEELARLEALRTNAIAEFATASRTLRADLYTAVTSVAADEIDPGFVQRVTGMDFEPDSAAWRNLDVFAIAEQSFWNSVDILAARIAAHDRVVGEDTAQRAALREGIGPSY